MVYPIGAEVFPFLAIKSSSTFYLCEKRICVLKNKNKNREAVDQVSILL